MMGSTQRWRGALSGGREHSVVMGNTQQWQGTLSGSREHPVVAGSMQRWWGAPPEHGTQPMCWVQVQVSRRVSWKTEPQVPYSRK